MALIHVNFFAQTLGMERSMDVILPQGQNGIGQEGQETLGDVPVLYLLHGASDDHTIWQRRTSIERYAVAKGLAVVMPSTDLGFYTDMKYGYDFFAFFSQELPDVVHEFFPMITWKREKTFVAGLSMGGFGALKLGILCPEQYGYAASLSGCVDPVREIVEGGDFLVQTMGSAEEAQQGLDDLPYQLEKALEEGKEMPKFLMGCGTEDFLYPMNVDFYQQFDGRIDLTYYEEPGTHEWGFWDRGIQRILEWLPLAKEGQKWL